ncbi:hypothetical protein J2S40_003147 [Nocardioides luteus]|uniref:hypothetical protein n=1 Tax=Nocardioides luteus TaxID=1844 RepID=UPI00166975B1|nr:hypothetical protein [Nocardioides luteus]MDR7312089.1 hypothetical protein [Nocardioides luteus]
MSYPAPPPPPPPPPPPLPSSPPTSPAQPPAPAGTAAKQPAATVITIAVIVTAVVLQVVSALIGLVVAYLFDGLGPGNVLTSIVSVAIDLLLHIVVAVGAAVIARTSTGRVLGLLLPMLSWLLSTVFYYVLVPQLHLFHPVLTGLVSPLLLLLVLAGWGFAAWAGRRWLIGLPITFVLLIAVQATVSFAVAPALAFDNLVSVQIYFGITALATTAVVVLGGVVCGLLDRSERR